MDSTTATGSVSELLGPPLRSAAGNVVVVSGQATVLRETVHVVADASEAAPEHVRLLGTDRALTEACDDFLVAARGADLTDDGRLSMRTADESSLPSVIVTNGDGGSGSNRDGAAGSVTSISALPDTEAVAVRTDDADTAATIRRGVDRSFANGTAYDVDAPRYSRFLDTLDSAVGPGVRDDVASVLDTDVTVRSSAGRIDEIDAVLLMAGRNGSQLYELSEWAEDVGLTSRATISSRKRQLESAGLLTTEKIRANVGRPRQRLLVGSDRLSDATPADLIRAARSVLAEE